MTDSDDDWRSRPPSDGPTSGNEQPGNEQPGNPLSGNHQYGSPQYGNPAGGVPNEGITPYPTPDQDNAGQYGGPPYGTPGPDAGQYGTPQYGTPQYGAPQYGAGAPYGSAPYAGAPGFGPTAPMAVVPKPPSISDGFAWAWARFSANAGILIGAAAVWAVIMVIGVLLSSIIVGGAVFAISTATSTVSFGAQLFMTLALTVVMVLIGAAAFSCWLNGLIAIADGARVEFGDFFRPRAFATILMIMVAIGIISAISELAFNYGLGMAWVSTLISIVIGLLTMWMVYVAADQRADIGTAVSTGLTLSTENLGSTIVVYLVSMLLGIVGVILLVVGLLVTLPLSGLLMIYYLRSLTQRPVVVDAPPAQPAY